MKFVKSISRIIGGLKMESNNNSSVKNYQSDSVIKKMYNESFNCTYDNIKIKKLSGGLKNAVYLIQDLDKKVVLKIASKDETKMITADRNTFWWEAKMLELMKTIDIPSPRLLHFDNSCNTCGSPYIFMTYIEGENYLKTKEILNDEENKKIEYQLGKICSKICNIKGQNYFLPSQPNKKFNDNYEFILNLFNLLLNDALEKNMDLGKDTYKKIKDIIITNEKSLNSNINLSLCHTDIWHGNILIDNGNVSGVVDFSDLYYCDELMTFYFHTIDGKTSIDFLKGFNNKVLSNDELTRIEIYRMYVILKMIVDCELKQYGKFDWMYSNLNTRISNLQKKTLN